MSQFNPLPPPPPATFGTAGYALPPAVPTTSKLAVASLVFALFVCLVVIGPVLAIGLGVAALVVISRSNGKTKGSGLAAAGIAVGSLLLLAECGGAAFYFRVIAPRMRYPTDRFAAFLKNVEQGEFDDARELLGGAARAEASRENLAAMRRLLNSRHGPMKQAKFDILARASASGVRPPPNYPISLFMAGRSAWTGGTAAVRGTIPISCEFGRSGWTYGMFQWSTRTTLVASQMTAQEDMLIDSFTLVGPNGPWTFPLTTASGPARAGGSGDGTATDLESDTAGAEDTESGA